MSTNQQQQTIPTGFTERDWYAYNEGVDLDGLGFAEEQTWGVHDGPRSGSVLASWAPDRGFAFEVDPCGIDETMWGTMTPRQARRLASELVTVADRIEELQTDGVRDAARRIAHSRGGGTVTDLARAADALGVRVTTVYAAWEVERAQLSGDDA